MNLKPIVLVTGATGAQGGSVARALIQSGEYVVRALTRNPESQKARDLQLLGAELITGDLNDLESLQTAVQDTYAVFGVTSWHEHMDLEYQQGKNLIDAVARMGVWHLVMSTQPDYHRLSEGKFFVPHYDAKAAIERYAREKKVPATFVHMSFYFENFINLFPLQELSSGVLEMTFPQGDARLPMISVEDLGGMVATILDHPKEYIGRTVTAMAEDRRAIEYAEIFTRILRKPVDYRHITKEEFTETYPESSEMAEMFEVQRLYLTHKRVDLIESHGLNQAMQSFEGWLLKNRKKIPVVESPVRRILIY